MNIFKNSRFAVSLIFAINGMVFGTWASRIPAIVDFHDLSPGSLGLLIFLAGLSAVIAFSVFGRAADKYGAAFITKRATIFLIPLTLIFIAFANSIGMLVMAVIYFGAIHGGDDVAMNAWAAEVEREYTRPVMSSFHAMWSLGAGIGAGLGSLLAFYEVGFKNHFSLISIIIFVLALSAAFVPFESQKNKKEANSPFISIPKGSLLPVATITFFASLSDCLLYTSPSPRD